MSRPQFSSRPFGASIDDRFTRVPRSGSVTEFYREEFLRYHDCLQQQREYYSERTIDEVEAALTRLLGQLDHLCRQKDADRVVSELLKKLNLVTGLSAWRDPKTLH